MIHLLYCPNTASMVPHIMLEELGVPYQRVLVGRAVDAHKAPQYLKLNPTSQIPVLVQDETPAGPLVLYETAGNVLRLSDTRPEAALAPPMGSVARAHFCNWLMLHTNALQTALIVYFCSERWVAQDNAGAVRKSGRRPRVWRRDVQRARCVCLLPVPQDPKLRVGTDARSGPSGALPAGYAGAGRGAAGDGGGATAAAVRWIDG